MLDQGAIQMARCSTLSQTREEDSAGETEADSDKADMVNLDDKDFFYLVKLNIVIKYPFCKLKIVFIRI